LLQASAGAVSAYQFFDSPVLVGGVRKAAEELVGSHGRL
jgi:hypothetical protein